MLLSLDELESLSFLRPRPVSLGESLRSAALCTAHIFAFLREFIFRCNVIIFSPTGVPIDHRRSARNVQNHKALMKSTALRQINVRLASNMSKKGRHLAVVSPNCDDIVALLLVRYVFNLKFKILEKNYLHFLRGVSGQIERHSSITSVILPKMLGSIAVKITWSK